MKASSAGYLGDNFARITINDVTVRCKQNGNEKHQFRGLHIAVVNPENGEVETAQVFDTYKTSHQLDHFIHDGIPKGYIIIAACKDDCAKNLS